MLRAACEPPLGNLQNADVVVIAHETSPAVATATFERFRRRRMEIIV